MFRGYLRFGLSPNVFPPRSERGQLEQNNFPYARVFFFSCLLKVLLACYYIYTKNLYSLPYIVNCTPVCECCIAIPALLIQNRIIFTVIQASLPTKPHYKELMQIYFCLVCFMLTAINSKAYSIKTYKYHICFQSTSKLSNYFR